jgi:hypothetical protein
MAGGMLYRDNGSSFGGGQTVGYASYSLAMDVPATGKAGAKSPHAGKRCTALKKGQPCGAFIAESNPLREPYPICQPCYRRSRRLDTD